MWPENPSHKDTECLLADREIDALALEELEVRVSSGPGQWGISRWRR